MHINPLLAQIRSPGARNIGIHVDPAAERAIRAGHPWLYTKAILRQSHAGTTGDLAILFDRKKRFLAVGLYDAGSPIRVRILQTRAPAPIDQAWFSSRIAIALERRTALTSDRRTTGFRLIHGENDGFPGLVLDRYDEVGVLKLYSPAWFPHLAPVVPVLLEQTGLGSLILRMNRTTIQEQTFGLRDGQTIAGGPISQPVRFQENGLLFEADVVQGQKTGFFFDHRDNRAQVEQLAGGRRVLNVFAYTGAFSLYAARGGAGEVASLDSSNQALAAATVNFALNQNISSVRAAQHETIAADAFLALRELQTGGRRFDMIIVDPPTLAGKQSAVSAALSAYRKLVRDALALLDSGGILVMASCTARVPRKTFFQTIHEVAHRHGRTLQTIAETGHAVDHPIGFKEGAYLKCLFARVL